MNLKNLPLILLFLLSTSAISAQGSYVKQMTIHDDSVNVFYPRALEYNAEGLVTASCVSRYFDLVIDIKENEEVNAWKIRYPEMLGIILPTSRNLESYKAYRGFIGSTSPYYTSSDLTLTHLNTATEEVKSLLIGGASDHLHDLKYLNDSIMVFTHGNDDPMSDSLVSLGWWNFKQDTVFRNLIYTSNLSIETGCFIEIISLDVYDDGSLLIGGRWNCLETENGSFILKTDSLGIPQQSYWLGDAEGRLTSVSLDVDENVFLTGLVQVGSGINNFGGTEIKNGFVHKLSPDLEPLWSRQIVADNFSGTQILGRASGSDFYFVYQTAGYYPVISGYLNAEGTLFADNGYSFYSFPYIEIGADNSSYFTALNLIPVGGGGTLLKFLLVKTLPDGTIEDCPQFTACAYTDDFDFPAASLTWSVAAGGGFLRIPVSVAPVDVSMDDFCDTPTFPTPAFTLPDTICQADCLTPDSLNNRLANHVEWRITGPGVDTLVVDTSFFLCFEQAGDYLIQQEVWALGCSEMNSHVLTVLADDLAPPLGEDRTICEPELYLLEANSSRPLRAFLWQDSSSTPAYAVTESGLYTLEASDGFCSVHDSVQLTFLADATGGQVALSVPEDTVLCEAFFPYALVPSSPFAEIFSLENQTATQFDLREAGLYTVSAEVFGCTVQENFRITTDDCRAAIYLPNAFSPNDDGVNDLLSPQGKDFLGLELQVFDRWGNQLLAHDAPPFAWDGKARGKTMPSGVYVIVFKYQNTRTGLEEQVSGEVTLVR